MQSTNEIEILNTALRLALEWGENWLQPVQSRLAKHYPQLSPAELDSYNDTVQKAMRFGWEEVENLRKIDRAFYPQWEATVLQVYPWITEENLSHMFSQGCYYALK